MANADFNNIEEFIDGFTKTDPYAETLYDGIIWGMEFTYNGRFYRLTRDRGADADTFVRIRGNFGKPNGYYIEVYRLPQRGPWRALQADSRHLHRPIRRCGRSFGPLRHRRQDPARDHPFWRNQDLQYRLTCAALAVPFLAATTSNHDSIMSFSFFRPPPLV